MNQASGQFCTQQPAEDLFCWLPGLAVDQLMGALCTGYPRLSIRQADTRRGADHDLCRYASHRACSGAACTKTLTGTSWRVGSDTVSHTLAFALYALAQDTAAQDRCAWPSPRHAACVALAPSCHTWAACTHNCSSGLAARSQPDACTCAKPLQQGNGLVQSTRATVQVPCRGAYPCGCTSQCAGLDSCRRPAAFPDGLHQRDAAPVQRCRRGPPCGSGRHSTWRLSHPQGLSCHQ